MTILNSKKKSANIHHQSKEDGTIKGLYQIWSQNKGSTIDRPAKVPEHKSATIPFSTLRNVYRTES